MSGIFKAYDVSGFYPGELDERIVKKIGEAYVFLLIKPKIVIGRDMRLSSPSLSSTFVEGALGWGASLTDIGIVTTPRLYYAISEGRLDSGVMVTASHLPREMNGFKLCWEEAIPLSGDKGLLALENMVNLKLPNPNNQPTKDSYQKSEAGGYGNECR